MKQPGYIATKPNRLGRFASCNACGRPTDLREQEVKDLLLRGLGVEQTRFAQAPQL